MILERPAAARGEVSAGWLHSRHTFSFGHFYDPQWMGFGPLRVVNEDIVAPGGGFPPHRHANMEILSVVLSGALAHRDNTTGEGLGGEGVLRPGEVQWMSAGHGVEHSEFNGSKDEAVHFLQIWIQPDRLNAQPAYEQRAFDARERDGRWQTLAAPDGADGGLPLRQQAWLRAVRLTSGQAVEVALDPARKYWLHVATGDVDFDGRALTAGDALGFADEAGTRRLAGRGAEPADVLFFELPA
ncbi:Pirin-related protein [Lysobacter dokdonensis DS-58]|uniref:Pirin-related protein n=1 Tax=Lysobacter dokdonensis DS-58 TaxID=1300345 RepID=A0A0A2WDH7_9GAMM|nr:pirin family protein [Lysobacter dokdonensis]KGQ18261.1 Pirin-related protein [Lysobacter dokdonensis DS-58]